MLYWLLVQNLFVHFDILQHIRKVEKDKKRIALPAEGCGAIELDHKLFPG